MLFSSIVFLFIFLPLVLFVYFAVLHQTKHRNYWLLIVSLFFYAWGEPVYVFLMLTSILSNYLLGLWIAGTQKSCQRKMILILAVIINLSILFYFKYYNFFAKNLYTFLNLQLPQLNLALPIGISFFTFQAMSYVIDLRGFSGDLMGYIEESAPDVVMVVYNPGAYEPKNFGMFDFLNAS